MAGPGASRQPVVLPGVRSVVSQLSALQRISAALAALGSLFLFLGMAFSWYAISVTVQGAGLSQTQRGVVGFGDLLSGDVARRYSGLGGPTGSRPDIDSHTDWYAAGYLVLTVVLVVLVCTSLLVRGALQLYLRIGSGTAAAVSLILVILISADLADMARAVEAQFRQTLGELGGVVEIEYAVVPSVGAGLVLSVLASVLLGVSAVLNQPRAAAPVAGPAGTPTGWPAQYQAPPPPPGYGPPPAQ